MIRVMIVDDHPVIRSGLRNILAATEDIEVLCELPSGENVLGELSEKDYDVIVMDVKMPGRSGLDVLRDIKRAKPGAHVLIISGYAEEQFAVRAMRLGASGFLVKACEPGDVIGAVRKVAQGDQYITPSVAHRLLRELGPDEPPHRLLSDREFEVMNLMAAGKGLSAIADELALSIKTVSTYRRRILDKMRMTNNAQIIRYAVEHNL